MTFTKSSNYQNEVSNETIRELASRHLKDPNHTTTDEEIRNAKVVIDLDEKVREILQERHPVLS